MAILVKPSFTKPHPPTTCSSSPHVYCAVLSLMVYFALDPFALGPAPQRQSLHDLLVRALTSCSYSLGESVEKYSTILQCL